jgi:hypothetical protein
VVRVAEVRFEDLPEIVVRDAAPGGPSVEGAPGLQMFDGLFRLAPWPDGPKREVRLVPIGACGLMRWGYGNGAWHPFYRSPRNREGWGDFGAVSGIAGNGDLGQTFAGQVEYTTVDDGPGGALAVDYVRSVLQGAAAPAVARWGHVDAAPVVDRWVHSFRGWPANSEVAGKEGPAVTFMLPAASLGNETRDEEHTSGILVEGHSPFFSALTSFSLPAGRGRGALARFEIERRQIARWVPQPQGFERPPRTMRILLSSSQTSVEPSPRVRVVIFAG